MPDFCYCCVIKSPTLNTVGGVKGDKGARFTQGCLGCGMRVLSSQIFVYIYFFVGSVCGHGGSVGCCSFCCNLFACNYLISVLRLFALHLLVHSYVVYIVKTKQNIRSWQRAVVLTVPKRHRCCSQTPTENASLLPS